MKHSKEKINKILHIRIKNRSFLKFISFFLSISLLFFLYSKGIIAPLFINGEPVKLSEILEIYKNEGSTNIFDRIISEKLIEIEAKRRNIIVKKEEVDKEIKKHELEAIENGKTLAQLLAEKDKTLRQLEKDTKVRLTLYKILGSSITYSDEDIEKIIEDNPWIYKDNEEMETVREEVRRLIIDRSFERSYQSWIRDAKAQSTVNYFIKL